jgi:hypothetical protein
MRSNYGNRISGIIGIPGAEAILTAVIFLLGVVLCFAACVHQKKQELLDFKHYQKTVNG